MAFCTSCGATVNGAFCSQCGTSVRAASAAPSANPAAAAPALANAGVPPGSMPPPVAKSGTSPIVWILVAVGGLFVLFLIGIFGIGALFVHKAHQAGLSTELMRRNPAAAIARMAAVANKDVEIVGEDDNAGTITLRDRNTGKTVTMAFDQVKKGFRISADGDDGKRAEVQFGGGPIKLPGWVPEYPGSDIQGTFSARGTDGNGEGAGGNYTFTTSDSSSHVMSFYEGKAKDLGMKVNFTASGAGGGTMIAADDNDRRSLTVIVGSDSRQTTVNVTYGEKR